ncbi:hypothetical protein J4457_00705 [Candidatus Woesearchaeota archaeon]|nr:hypothetical protein [Candidatus Woesearchaeota archaeon]
MWNKKASHGGGGGAIGAIFVVIMIVFMLLILVNDLVDFSKNFIRECSDNLQCNEEQYCGADFKCHEIPVKEKTIVQEYYSYDLVSPAIIIGIALVCGSLILKKKNKKEEGREDNAYYQQYQQQYQQQYPQFQQSLDQTKK